jgi:hypothetical protein
MPFWIMLIPQLVKLIIEIWVLLRKKPSDEGQKVRSEVDEIFRECPDARTCRMSREKLIDRLKAVRDRLKS